MGLEKTTCIWSEHDYFKQQPCDFHLDKENYPENSDCCINQGYPSYKDNKKLYHAEYYIWRQKIECINPPEMLRIMSVRRKISRCTECGMIQCLGKFLTCMSQYNI